MQKIDSAEDIQRIANIFRESRILLTAVELDVFTAISEERLSSKEIALRILADEKAADRLLNALTVMGLLEKSESRFSNTKTSLEYLVKGKEKYIGNLNHAAKLWESWNDLTEVVRTGEKSRVRDQKNRSGEWLESFIAAMHYRAVEQAKVIADILDLSLVEKSLDVGGGSGAFTIGFVKKNPKIRGIVFDLPNVIPLTKRYAEEAGVQGNIDFIKGDYHSDDFGNGYDLIFISAVAHINSPEENRKLISKCYEALNTGGQIVIKDFIMNEERIEPGFGTLFAINMLVNTENGDAYTHNEIRSWLKENGFREIHQKETGFGSSLMIGKKL